MTSNNDHVHKTLREKLKFALLDTAEEMDDAPPVSWRSRIAAFVLPAAVIAFGVRTIVRGEARIWQRLGFAPHTVTGPAAIVVGCITILLGLIVHFKMFWYPRNRWVGVVGMVGSFLLVILLLITFSVLLILQPSLVIK